MLNYFDNSHLYTLFEMKHMVTSPLNIVAQMGKEVHTHPLSPVAYTPVGRQAGAFFELLERFTRKYMKPEFGIEETEIGGKTYQISEEKIIEKPFCTLLHFQKTPKKTQPKLLVVAPLSGHYATLLRGTVRALLPHFDVYITDWANGADVPLSYGPFGFDDYTNYVIEFIHTLGKNVHVMAVCQPSVPVMAAVSLMATEKDPLVPKTATLIGGPIDTRINPTKVNETAEGRSIDWFEQNVITHVPFNYVGFMRRVYPGFLQLTGFMTMNLDRHLGEHMKLYQHLIEGDGDSAEAHRSFYDEYLSVMDLPAEFYLETVQHVFIEHALPKGTLVVNGQKVRPEDITKTAILTIEGERDDISGVGQTKATLDLCKNLPAAKKKYHLQKGVGHYGTFNGRRYREHIVPAIVDFAKKNS